MPITLVTTIGGASANSYVSLAEADAYFALRPNATAWTDITDDDERSKLLLWAMRSLSGLGWIGGKASITQALDWPRFAIRPAERRTPVFQLESVGGSGLYDLNGYFWAATVIPTGVKNAQCEQALASQQSTAWTTTEKYKRRIIQNKEGLIEFRTGGAIGGMSSLAASELSGLLITGAAMSLVSR